MNTPSRILTATLLLFASGTAWGQQVTLQSSGVSYATIGEAIDFAIVGDTLTIDPGTYAEAVSTDKNLTIVGAGSALVTISWEAGFNGVVIVDPLISLDLSGVTLSSGGIRGLFADLATSVNLTDVVFQTAADISGGGADLADTVASFTDCVFDGTTAAVGNGGAIASSSTDLTVTSTLFQNTTAGFNGGAIYSVGGSLTVVDSTFDGGSASGGGAIYSSVGSITLVDSIFDGGSATSNGGAVETNAALTVTGGSFSGNTALGNGGAIAHTGVENIDVAGAVFCANEATFGAGGAIDARSVGGSFTNTVFAENTASTGGALHVSGTSTWTVTNNHFLANDSGGGAAVESELLATVAYTNNLFAYNLGFAMLDNASDQLVEYNAFYNNTLGDNGGAVTLGAGTMQAVDPLLEYFTANGDCSDDSFWPAFDSPLIDAGAPFLDPDNTVSDIGAYGGPGADPSRHLTDADGDGFNALTDCDDNDASAKPGGIEICDGADNDCNRTIDDDYAVDAQDWFPDADGDGWGDDSYLDWVTQCVAPDPTWVNTWRDCDDNNPAINPDAVELCDPIDWDCDGSTTNTAIDKRDWFEDVDGDGYGDDATVVVECFAPDAGWVQIGGDCEPADAAINPGAVEICNGVDENCSGGEEDAPGAAPWYPDLDGDTFGDDAGVIVDCTPVPDYVADGGDCDDDDANSFPGGVEVCDGIDNDCSGIPDDGYPEVDWWPDLDEDGFGSALRESRRHFCAPYEPYQSWVTNDGDCDDDNNAVHPDADEICNDIDDDCDGLADLDDDDLVDGVLAWDDIDGDGYGSGEPALVCDVDGMALVDGDCDDMAPLVNPDQAEIPDNDVDEDCDGNTPKSPVEEVVDDGCQCSQSSGPPSGLVALLALVLIRRRRDHES